tara:strand:+ start:1055 stop:1798 length:744 start_codon:yes stop_codon:yes gene_type:complete
VKIFAPSYKRSEGVKTHLLLPDIVYCVHQFEAEKYIQKGYNVKVLPDNTKGNIARVRNYILDHFIKDVGLIIDDDIEGIKYWSKENGLPKTKSIENITEFIEEGFNLCRQFDCRLWGINIIGDKGSYREYSPFSLTNTISGSFMGFINNSLRFDERLPLKEDYDYSIQNCNEYRKLLRLNYAYMIKKDHGNLGGCADYRTIEREREQLKLLQNKWGNKIVKNDTTQRGAKTKGFDINPILKIPIKGI